MSGGCLDTELIPKEKQVTTWQRPLMLGLRIVDDDPGLPRESLRLCNRS